MIPRTELQSLQAEIESWPEIALFSLSESTQYVRLEFFQVKYGFRGRGVGKRALDYLKQYALKYSVPLVLVPNAEEGKQTALNRFYKRQGFRPNTGKQSVALLPGLLGEWIWVPEKREEATLELALELNERADKNI